MHSLDQDCGYACNTISTAGRVPTFPTSRKPALMSDFKSIAVILLLEKSGKLRLSCNNLAGAVLIKKYKTFDDSTLLSSVLHTSCSEAYSAVCLVAFSI